MLDRASRTKGKSEAAQEPDQRREMHYFVVFRPTGTTSVGARKESETKIGRERYEVPVYNREESAASFSSEYGSGLA